MQTARILTARRPLSALTTALLALLCALGLTAALATFGALPAQAHDRLTGTEPADGAALDAPPSDIALTFSTEPLDVEPQVVVTDADGEVVLDDAPTIDGTTATLPVTDGVLTGGEYTVAWRVVSADGHPIEGTFGFAVADQPEESPSQDASAAPSDDADDTASDDTASDDTASDDASDTASDDASAAPSDGAATTDAASTGTADGSSSALPLVLGIGAVVVIGAVVTVLVVRRGGADRGAGPGGQD
ncbi:copper resistance protein CopC [Cellulosimicrobium terreum]|nr:copper resistance protein CopC [Cellulosimicrobium terreum]